MTRPLSGFAQSVSLAFQRFADRVALEAGDRQWTYEQLNQVSAAWADVLQSQGCGPGDAVVLRMPRSAEIVVAMLAVVRLGAIYVPIDPESPPQRQERILSVLQPRFGIGTSPQAEASAGTVWIDVPPVKPGTPPLSPWVDLPDGSPLYVMFTSGSTGLPKGVVVPGTGVLAVLADRNFADMPADARWLQVTSPAFDISNLEIWGALLHGACCVVLDRPLPSLDDLAAALQRGRITHAQMSTSLFNAMVDERLDALAGLRQMVVGGERASPLHMRRFLERHPDIDLINAYGPTETTIWSLGHRVTVADTFNDAGVPIGRPVEGTQLYIDAPDPASAVGELWIAGLGVSMGYLNNPEQTRARFVHRDGARWYRTGDLVHQRDDGLVEYLGRMDRQVKINGIRIELDEIELALGSVAGVGEVAVQLIVQAGSDPLLVGFYTETAGTVDHAEIRRHMGQRIPLSTVPRHLIRRKSMPRNTNGKLDRARLEALWQAGQVSEVSVFASALRESVLHHAGAVAIEVGQERWTYGQLDIRSRHLANALKRHGLQAGDTVALLMPRSADLIIAMISAIRCGATYAALDLGSPAHRLSAMLGVLRPRLILSAGAHPEGLDTHGARSLRWSDVADVSSPADTDLWDVATSKAAVCVMFTSGSTGVPKGVLVPGAGIHRLVIDADYAQFRAGQRWAFLSSPAFDASHLEIWGPLLNGGTCVVFDGTPASLDDVSDFLRGHGITDAWLTAALFNAMVDFDLECLAGLHQLLIGGERLSVAHVRAVTTALPGLALLNGYGPTENTTFTLCHRISAADLDADGGIPIGRPIHGTLVRIAENAAQGELLAGGSGVALGYLNNDEATAERFVRIDNQRWYRTGDLVRQRGDGSYSYLGRLDRQMKIQGHRIELDEVELALTRCPGVGEAVVIVVGASAADRHLVGLYSGSGGEAPEPDMVATHAAQLLPPGALPRRLVRLDTMPRNASGKLDRALLEQLHGGTSSDSAQNASALEVPLPPGSEHAALAAIWRRYLPGVHVEDSTSFIEAGGTSLIALRMAAAIARDLQKSVSPLELLRRPLFSDHLACVDAAPLAPAAMAGPEYESGPPLTRGQQHVISASILSPAASSLLVHVGMLCDASLQTDSLRAAIECLADRHPMLRLAPSIVAGRTRTRLLPAPPEGWWRERGVCETVPLDLSWPDSVLDTISRPMAIEVDGPMRADCWRLPDGRSLLVWTIHHFAIDEHSIDRALFEINEMLCRRQLAPVYGSPFAMPALEKAWSDRAAVRRLSQQLATELRHARLPYERHRFTGRELGLELPPALEAKVLSAAARWGWTPFPILLAGFGMAVQHVFGPEFKRILTPFSRRAEPELNEPISYFIDVRHVEAGVRNAETHDVFLSRVHRSLAQAQRPLFELLKDVIDETTTLDPRSAQLLGAFFFSWRLSPSRNVPLGAARAELLRVQQRGVRFDLAMHAAEIDGRLSISIEAVDPLIDHGQVQQLMESFVLHLDELCQAEPVDADDHGAPAISRTGPGDGELREALARIWRRWAPYSAEVPALEDHFVRQGGSSLAAMRMASELKRQTGIRLDTGSFLAKPTFGRLLAAVAPDRAERELDSSVKQDLALIGNPGAPAVVLLIPGRGGQAVGLLRIASELQRISGPDCMVAIADLDRIVARFDVHGVGPGTLNRIVELARALGLERIRMVGGFSLGGSIALQLARQLGADLPARICLLDTFCARPLEGRMLRSIEARVARLLHRPPRSHEVNADPPSSESSEHIPSAAEAAVWRALETHVLKQPQSDFDHKVMLIQAEHSRHQVGMLWRQRTNGFLASEFAEFSVYRIPAWHMDLVNRSARLAAHTMAAELGLVGADGPSG